MSHILYNVQLNIIINYWLKIEATPWDGLTLNMIWLHLV